MEAPRYKARGAAAVCEVGAGIPAVYFLSLLVSLRPVCYKAYVGLLEGLPSLLMLTA